MSGLNHNMNHIVKRIETRVLAPPGGHSSFSIGHNFVDVRTQKGGRGVSGGYGAPAPVPMRALPAASARESYGDSARCNIPGLEQHYGGGRHGAAAAASRSPADDDSDDYDDVPQTSFTARNMVPLHYQQQQQQQALTTIPASGRRVLSQAEYAAELRQQMLEKRTRDHLETMERGGNERRSLTKTQLLEERVRALAAARGAAGGPPAQPTGRKASASAYRSSWSIANN